MVLGLLVLKSNVGFWVLLVRRRKGIYWDVRQNRFVRTKYFVRPRNRKVFLWKREYRI